jgi:hypothetical protein
VVVQPLGVAFQAQEGEARPAWPSVEERQRASSDAYLLISQPDHAKLSGDLARRFVSPAFPRLSEHVIAAIGAHDEGWRVFPGEADGDAPLLTSEGKPRSFIEFEPAEFTRAWTGSIHHAASLSAVAGILVSRHFVSLGEFALRKFGTQDEVGLRAFLDSEAARQKTLLGECGCSPKEFDEGLQALQFCDLLSLALCCEVREEIEFPQCFGAQQVRMRFHDGYYELTPSPFQDDAHGPRDVQVSVAARTHDSREPVDLVFRLR